MNWLTPGPVSSTTPDKSEPSVSGRGGLTVLLLSRISASHGPTPAAATRTISSRWHRAWYILKNNNFWSTEVVDPCRFHDAIPSLMLRFLLDRGGQCLVVRINHAHRK